MKKSASKNQIYTGDEMKRYVGALHEEHMASLKVISEQFFDVNRKLDSHDEKLDSHTEMIGQMNMKMTVMQEDIQFIKSGLKRKVDQDEFDALVRRVSVVEKRVLK
ncbi:MAG: hypothetical protein Q7S86_01010 [bacterium]|nr:hypothetical protein [bacterium]